MKTGIIILAAGPSSRLGKSKQMLDIAGETLLVKTVKAAIGAHAGAVVVVLGFNEEAHRRLLIDLHVDIAFNEHWQSGMGSSIKAGLISLLAKDVSLELLIILVCDQPLLTTENITNLILKHEETGKSIIASRYSNIPGVPVLFDKTCFPKLMALSDNEGAKKIILHNTDDVSQVDFPGGEIDLDTVEDYEAFRNREL